MERYNRIMQYFWLVVAILAGVFAIFTLVTEDEDASNPLVYVMPLLAFVLFLSRMWMNKKVSKAKKEREHNSDSAQ